jgi:hypothetical protein
MDFFPRGFADGAVDRPRGNSPQIAVNESLGSIDLRHFPRLHPRRRLVYLSLSSLSCSYRVEKKQRKMRIDDNRFSRKRSKPRENLSFEESARQVLDGLSLIEFRMIKNGGPPGTAPGFTDALPLI